MPFSPQIFPVEFNQIEGKEIHMVVSLAMQKQVELRNPTVVACDRLAIEGAGWKLRIVSTIRGKRLDKSLPWRL